MRAYLDNSATTAPCLQAIEASNRALSEAWQNPSAAYASSIAINREMDDCRGLILKKLGGKGSIVFTSGGTESDHIAIAGAMKKRGARLVVTTSVEHPAVLRNAENYENIQLPVNNACGIDLDAFEKVIKENENIGIVSCMHVNNETGAIFPIEQMAKIVHENSQALFHSDGVQGFLHVPSVDMKDIDLYSISGHKIHAPKGIGALYIKNGIKINTPVVGGGQENGLRSGTENTAGIYALKAAVESDRFDYGSVISLKMKLYEGIKEIFPKAVVNGPDPKSGAAHILNISFPGILAEVLLHALEGEGIYVSTGSACAARQSHPSHVLKAMGLPGDRIKSAIRFSLSGYTTEEEINMTLEALARQLPVLARFKRR